MEEKKIRLALDDQTPVCEPHEDHSEEEVVEIDNIFLFSLMIFLPEEEVEVHRVEVDNDDRPSCKLKSVAPEHLVLLQEDDRQQGEPADWRQDSF